MKCESIKALAGGVYRREPTFCHKKGCKKCESGEGHGPYWYRYWSEDGKTRKKYIGKNLPEEEFPWRLELTEEERRFGVRWSIRVCERILWWFDQRKWRAGEGVYADDSFSHAAMSFWIDGGDHGKDIQEIRDGKWSYMWNLRLFKTITGLETRPIHFWRSHTHLEPGFPPEMRGEIEAVLERLQKEVLVDE